MNEKAIYNLPYKEKLVPCIMTYDPVTNVIGEVIVRSCGRNASLLDDNNILWKVVNDRWVGKRSVWTFDNRSCWLEETSPENIKSWWCGKDADYNVIMERDITPDKSCA